MQIVREKNDSVIMLSGRSQNGFKMLDIVEKYGIIQQEQLAIQVMLDTLKEYEKYFE